MFVTSTDMHIFIIKFWFFIVMKTSDDSDIKELDEILKTLDLLVGESVQIYELESRGEKWISKTANLVLKTDADSLQ